MIRWSTAVLALAAASCERLPAPPQLDEVSPPIGRAGAPVPLTIKGQFPVRVFADIGGRGRTGLDTTYQAWLDEFELTDVMVTDRNTLVAKVPVDLSPGMHELIVRDPYGRQGVLPDAYEALPPATALAFESPEQFVAKDACSLPLVVGLRDANDRAATADVILDISLSAKPPTGLVFFEDAACSRPSSIVRLPAGRTSGKLYFRSSTPGPVDVTATDTTSGLTPATQTETITQLPTKLAITSTPQTVGAGICSEPVVVELQDGTGNPAAAPADYRVDIDRSGPAYVFLFDDAACATAASSLIVPRGSTSTSFTFTGTSPGLATVSASNTDLGNTSQDETIVAGVPASLAFLSPPQTLDAGACSQPAVVELQDAFGNRASALSLTTLTLASTSSSASFFVGPACGTPGATLTLASGNSTADFSFRDLTPGTPTLTVSSTGLDAATQVETILGFDGGADAGVDAGAGGDAGAGDAGSGSGDGGGPVFWTGTFDKRAGTGPQPVAHGLGVQPKVLILWTVGATNPLLAEPNFRFAIGVSTGPGVSWSSAGASRHDASNQNSARGMTPNALTMVEWGPTTVASADLSDWDASSMTLSWTTNTAAPCVIHYLLIGGASVRASLSQWAVPVSGGLRVNSSTGFEPDVVLHFWLGDHYVAPPAVTTVACPGIGAMDRAGNQWTVETCSGFGGARSNSGRSQRTDSTIYMTDTASYSVGQRAVFSSMNPLGFTVDFVVSASPGYIPAVMSLALAGVGARACHFDKSVGSTQSIADAGFQPGFVLLASYQETTMALPLLYDGRMGLGMTDGRSSASIAWNDTNNSNPKTDVHCLDTDAGLFLKTNNPSMSVEARANLAQFDPDGFTLNWEPNDGLATEILCLMLGSP